MVLSADPTNDSGIFQKHKDEDPGQAGRHCGGSMFVCSEGFRCTAVIFGSLFFCELSFIQGVIMWHI